MSITTDGKSVTEEQDEQPDPVGRPEQADDSVGRAGASSASDDVETPNADPDDVPAPDDVPRDPFPAWLQATALVVAALLMAAGLFSWWQAAHEDHTNLGAERDAALISARQHIETLNTLDYRSVDEGLAAWQSVTTGTLHDQFADVGKEQRTLLADQKKISTSKVVDAALLDFGSDSGTVIASLETTVQDDADPGSEPTVKRNRFSADIAKVDGKWLVENLVQVPVSIS